MKKTGEVFLLIGIILGFVTAVSYLLSGIFCAVFGSGQFHAEIVQALQQQKFPPEWGVTVEQAATYIEQTFVACGVCCFVFIPFSVASAILNIFNLSALKEEKPALKVLSILSIVFGVAGSNVCSLVGGILATVYSCKSK